jgi:hypothetical protein
MLPIAQPCHVCAGAVADCVLLPCRHSGICRGCAAKVEICPTCRAQISERMHVYTP